MKKIILTLLFLLVIFTSFSNEKSQNINNEKLSYNMNFINYSAEKKVSKWEATQVSNLFYYVLIFFPATNLIFISYWYPDDYRMFIFFGSFGWFSGIFSLTYFTTTMIMLSLGGFYGPKFYERVYWDNTNICKIGSVNSFFVCTIVFGSLTYLQNLIYGLIFRSIGFGWVFSEKNNFKKNKILVNIDYNMNCCNLGLSINF